MSARFVCFYCLEPLRKKDSDFTEETLIDTAKKEGILRLFHNRCVPLHAEPDSPFQAAVLRAKQAIADARRLSEEEYAAFADIVLQAFMNQREDLP